METQTSTIKQEKTEPFSTPLEEHIKEDISQSKCAQKDRRKGKPIPGFAREVILKVAEICEQEATNNYSKFPLSAPTKRAAMYTGVSQRTVQRIRNEDRKRKLSEDGPEAVEDSKKSVIRDHPDEESNYSTMKRKSKKGQTIPNSARDVILKVIDGCDREHKNGEFMVPFICRSKRTALYTGVSQRTVQRIKNEDVKRNRINQEKVLLTPGKKRKRSTVNDKVDDFDFYSIRQLIDDLILVKRLYPTCTALHTAVREKISFPYSEDTLYRLLHSKGFIWHKSTKGKRVLIERPEYFRSRLDFLQKIRNHEEHGKFIIYLDDAWIGRSKEDSYVNNNGIFGVKGGICCSGRIVILNEFSTMGFIRRAERLFKPNIVDSETKPKICTVDKWMKENLFPNIPANSVIIMSTYKKDGNIIPNKYSSKSTLVEFLKEKNLRYNPAQTCPDLYEIIENHFSKLPSEWNKIDNLIERSGHTVLRLPPFMSEFNPVELAWADIKRYVRDKNPRGKISPKLVREITLQAVECLQNNTLQGYVNHIIQMENYFWDKHRPIQEHYDNVTNNSSTNKSVYNSNNTVSTVNSCTGLPHTSTINNTSNININRDVHFTDKNINMTYINAALPATSIITSQSGNNMVLSGCALLPHSQLEYGRNMAMHVLNKSDVICENQSMEGVMVQAGPSYLNL